MKRIFNYILKCKSWVINGSIAMLFVILLDLCSPYLQKELLDEGIIGQNSAVVVPIITLLFGVTILKAIFGYVKEYLYDICSSQVQENIKNDLFMHIQTLEFKYFDDMNTGELMSRIGEDAETVGETVSYGLRLFVENIIYFILSSAILIYLNWKLALICIIVMIPIGIMGTKLEKKFDECYGKISDKTAEINTTAEENIAGVRLVRAFTREKYEIKKFMKLNKEFYNLNMEQSSVIAKYYPAMEFLTDISLILMVVFGGAFVFNEEMTLGTLIAFSGYIWNLIWPMRNFGELSNLISRNSASVKRIFKIMDRDPEVKKGSYAPKKIKGEIEFKNVTFKYNDEEVLKDINLKIPAGSTVAVMGTTGAGKTSLINLIGRYYDVFKGQVLIDGVDVRDYDLNVLRKNMSIVPQDIFLFSDTINNNIRFSNSYSNEEQIKNVCSTSCCIDFIERLEEGFDTEIGERGIGLSGGQKQRISIARALLRKAPILILDDATSALDMETEHNLLNNLRKDKSRGTTFIIAHRISAVRNSDMIIYVENGRIKEIGTHEELIRKKGCYFDIYKEQFKDLDEIERKAV